MRRLCSWAIVATVVVVMLQPCTLAGDEVAWPRFRGPNGSGVSHDRQPLPVEFGPDKNLIWKTPLPRGHSSPCISHGRIFLTGFDSPSNKLETLCLDRLSGQVLWRRTAPVEKVERVHEVNSPAASTPATDGERVFVYFGSYGILCYDLDGKELWKHPLPIPDLFFGTGASPIVADKYVVLNVDQQGESYLLAVDRKTGQQIWKHDRSLFGRGWSTPVHVRNDATDEVVVLGSRRLVAYGLADGAQRWSVGGLPPFTISSPVVDEGRLFLAATDEYGEPDNVVQPPTFDDFVKQHDKNRDGKIGAEEIPAEFAVVNRRASGGAGDTKLQGWFFKTIDLDKDNLLNREEWDKFAARMSQWPAEFNCNILAVRLGGQNDVTKTHIVWRASDGVPEVPSPLVYQGHVYTVQNGGIVYCRDARDGRVAYKRRLGAGGGYYASPVAGDGKVYFASDRGVVVVVSAGPDFEVLASNDLETPILATPALVAGHLYIRAENQIFAFGNSSRK